jgi:hypothetical protein
LINIYKFIGKKDKTYELETEQKLNANCPAAEKQGTGPGSCGGNKGSDKATGKHSIMKGGPQNPSDVIRKTEEAQSLINKVKNEGKTKDQLYEESISAKRKEAKYIAGKISPEDFYDKFKSAYGGNLPYITVPDHPDGKTTFSVNDVVYTTDDYGKPIEGKIYGFIKDFGENKMYAQLEVGNGSRTAKLNDISSKYRKIV